MSQKWENFTIKRLMYEFACLEFSTITTMNIIKLIKFLSIFCCFQKFNKKYSVESAATFKKNL